MRTQPKHDAARQLLLAAFLLGATAAWAGPAQLAAAHQAPIPAGVALKSWQDNGADGRYLLQILEGKPLKAGQRIVGVVTSDTDCEADAQGLSHCHNIIKLANGGQLTVIDTHNMHRNRCLGPGDQMTLTAAGKSWVIGTLIAK